MHRSSLSGLCGREHDDVAQPRETLDEGGSASRAQVLRNLDAQAQVEAPEVGNPAFEVCPDYPAPETGALDRRSTSLDPANGNPASCELREHDPNSHTRRRRHFAASAAR